MEINWEELKQDDTFKEIVKSSAEEIANTLVGDRIEEAVTDLKAKNAELIGEKRKLAERLDSIKDLDIEKAKKALDFVEKDETAKLLSEGKFDEVLESKLYKVKEEYESQIKTLLEEKEGFEGQVSNLKSKIDNINIESQLRKIASKAGILPDAIEDVLIRGKALFSIGEDGSLEAKDDKGEFIKVDGKLLTPTSWVSDLPRHYWPQSDGLGASGSSTGGDVDEKLAAAAKSGNMSAYRKLRSKKNK